MGMKKKYKIVWKALRWTDLKDNRGIFTEVEKSIVYPTKKLVDQFKRTYHGDKNSLKIYIIPSG